MINLFQEKMDYDVCVVDRNGKRFIEEAVKTIKWGGDARQAARKLEIECVNIPHVDIPLGSMFILYRSGATPKEIIRTIAFSKSKGSNEKNISYSSYDSRIYLLKNKHDRIFRNMTATEIIEESCKTFGIPIGDLVDTGVKFPSLQLIDKTLWDMFVIALTETRKVTGKRYITKMIGGKLCLVEKVKQVRKWVLEEGVNILDASYEESIEDTKTQVKVVGKDKDKKPLIAVVKDDNMQKLYGIMQEYQQQSEATTQDHLNKIASQLLKELGKVSKSASLSCIGLDDVEAGDAVYVIERTTGLVGTFYVENDEHTVTNRFHSMNLKLAWTDELPSIDYEPPADDKTDKQSKTENPIDWDSL